MMESPVLSNNGEPWRAPAQLNGTNDEGVRIYDNARVKNINTTKKPIDSEALAFSKHYIKYFLKKYLGVDKIKKLTDEELVKGLKEEVTGLDVIYLELIRMHQLVFPGKA